MHPQQPILEQLTREVVEDLFEGLLTPAPVEDSSGELEHTAIIAFRGLGIRGTLGWAMGDTVRGALAPNGCDLDDWQAEFANQLLGRLKRKLMREGVVIEVALPVVLRGVRVVVVPDEAPMCVISLRHRLGPAAVWLDVDLDAHVILARTDEPEFLSASEGEVILF